MPAQVIPFPKRTAQIAVLRRRPAAVIMMPRPNAERAERLNRIHALALELCRAVEREQSSLGFVSRPSFPPAA